MQIRIRDRIKYVHIREDIAANPAYKKWNIVDLVRIREIIQLLKNSQIQIYTIEWLKAFNFPKARRFQVNENFLVHASFQGIHVKAVSRMIATFTAAFWSYEQRNSEVTIMPDGMILVEGVPPRSMSSKFSFPIPVTCNGRIGINEVHLTGINVSGIREANMDRAYYFEIIQCFRRLRMDKQEYVLLTAIMACEPGQKMITQKVKVFLLSVHYPFLFS